MGCVYAIVFPNDKLYIGMTIKRLKDRKKKHKHDHIKGIESTLNLPVYRAMRKYGWNNLGWNVLFESEEVDELEEVEKFYISEYKTQTRESGYNVEEGGSYSVISKSTRQKISEALTGKFVGENARCVKLTWEKVREIREKFWTGNYTHKEISKFYNIGQSVIGTIIKNKNWKDENYIFDKEKYEEICSKNRSKAQFGEKGSSSKLTWEKVKEIRNFYKIGKFSCSELSKKFDVTYATISSVIKNVSWKEENRPKTLERGEQCYSKIS